MTILFAGGESQDFEIIGTFNSFTNETGLTAHRRSANTRSHIYYSINASNKETTFFRKTLPSTYTSLWATFRRYEPTNISTTGNLFFSFGNSNRRRIGIGGSGTNNKLSIIKIDNANTYTILATEAGTFTGATLYKYDVQIINYGATGTVNVYRANPDGTSSTLIMTYTGDLTTNSETVLSQIYFGVNAAATYSLTEVVVSDQDTRGMGLVTIPPDGDGNAYDFSGSYTNVSDLNSTTTTTSLASADGDLLQVTADTSRLGTPETIEAVVIQTYARSGNDIPDLTGVLRLNGVDYFDTAENPGINYFPLDFIFQLNPEDSALFEIADINDAGFNYGLRANV